MPQWKPSKKTRRKLGRQRRRYGQRLRRVPRGMSLVPTTQKPGYKGHPFGKKFYTKLRYSESHTIAAATTANFASSYKMRLNSLFDPNYSGQGHQPRGFDQLMAIYEKYTVVAAKITVCYITTSTNPSVVGLRLVDGNESSIVDKKVAMENGDSSWKYISRFDQDNKALLSRKVNVKKFFNQNTIVGTDKFTLDSNENPALDDAIIAELWVAPIKSTAQHGETLVDINIEYSCVFTEPKDLPQS